MLRTHTCGELRTVDATVPVTLCGWVHRRRDHGDLTFIDLRDRYGITQIVASAKDQPEAHAALKDVRSEWVLRIHGTVRERPAGTRNGKLATGDVEVVAGAVEVLNEAKTPPFYVNEETPVDETLRWKYRYVDLRRERSRDLMRLRHEVVAFIRAYFIERGFWEIETTNLIRSDPTGARDFVVPSRYYPGKFWALPQSPQQLKQILMYGGIDKYFQIARAYRDEDPRADRVYEHTQLDVELSFVEREDVMALIEDVYTRVIERFSTKPLQRKPWPRLTFADAMRRYGSDKPDLRFGMELVDLGGAFRSTGFAVVRDTLAAGGVVRGLVVPGKADAARKEIDAWTDVAKRKGAKGLLSFAFAGSEVRSPIAKFLTADELAAVRARSGAADGDLVLAVAGPERHASEALGTLRQHLGETLGLIDASTHCAVLIHDFPLVERTAEGGWTFAHNPFSGPLTPADVALLDTDPERARSTQYDFALDGRETAGGSVRIHQRSVQERVFQQMGIGKQEAAQRFGAILDALEYGAPPEGGFAGGIERLVMTLAGTENIREVQAFPKTQTGYDPLLDAPASIDAAQLAELGLKVVSKPETR
ncbi:MAG: aspartate--tRNA ligase [Chloroflexota bacterium]|nr:aspartate--tRNA ligase [Chloroflexota bacterium]MDE3194550.1 aspartate--tRNA ligase [Chloroflexota bacterium]